MESGAERRLLGARGMSTRFPLLALVPIAVVAGCATQRSAVRQLAARELACPEDAIHLAHDEGRLYRATGCGGSVRVACYDPNDSTGAHGGWADPLTAGNRVRCETILDRPVATTSATTTTARSDFDRALAARLLDAAAARARSCAPAGSELPDRRATAHVVFATDGTVSSAELDPPFAGTEVGRCVTRELVRVTLPPFSGEPVAVAKIVAITP